MYVMLSLFLWHSPLAAQSFDLCTPVQLTQNLPPEPDNGSTVQRKCKMAAAGRKGKIIYGSMEDKDTVYVHWDNSQKGCEDYEYYDYVPRAQLKAIGKPIGRTTDKECTRRDIQPCKVSHSETMEELIHKVDLADKNEFKSPEELEKYFACYASPDFQHYLSKYRTMIDTAAAQFGVEPALMKCLIFRESRWKKDTISCGCAMGLGQQLQINVNYIGNLLSNDRKALKKNPNADVVYARAWDSYMAKIKSKNPAWLHGCSGGFQYSDEVEAGSDFYKQQMLNREKYCGASATACKVFKQDDRRCEAASIAANAAYLKSIELLLPNAMKCQTVDWWQENDSLLAIALAYNEGEWAALKQLKASNKGLMSTNILDAANVKLDKRKEMRGHYNAIFNCMQKGNTRPQAEGDPWKKACFEKTIQAGPPGNSGVTR